MFWRQHKTQNTTHTDTTTAAECTWLRNENATLAATAGGLGTEVASRRRRVRETKAARGVEASEGRDNLLAENGALGQIS